MDHFAYPLPPPRYSYLSVKYLNTNVGFTKLNECSRMIQEVTLLKVKRKYTKSIHTNDSKNLTCPKSKCSIKLTLSNTLTYTIEWSRSLRFPYLSNMSQISKTYVSTQILWHAKYIK